MRTNIDCDLKRLRLLAYHRFEWGAGLLRKFHKLSDGIKSCPDFPLIEKLYSWLLIPISLWPVNLDAVGNQTIRMLQSEGKLSSNLLLLLEFLPDVPADVTKDLVMRHEHEAQKGRYDHVVRATHKLIFQEEELEQRQEFVDEWQKTCKLFNARKYQDRTGLIQRRFIPDVGNRAAWELNWDNETDRFFAVFNTFCHRWNLYGMDGDRPILLRTMVNVTASGTGLFVPIYQSFDSRRDMKWSGISALHRVRRGSSRQGPKLGMNRIERREEARMARRLIERAKAKGIKGTERDYWVMGQLGWDIRTQPNRLWRLMKWAGNKKIL